MRAKPYYTAARNEIHAIESRGAEVHKAWFDATFMQNMVDDTLNDPVAAYFKRNWPLPLMTSHLSGSVVLKINYSEIFRFLRIFGVPLYGVQFMRRYGATRTEQHMRTELELEMVECISKYMEII